MFPLFVLGAEIRQIDYNLANLTLVLLNPDMPCLQTVSIQISWLLQKPTDLDLHCLPLRM